MREPPPHVADLDVLIKVREHWLPDVGTVEHLPVGFGAHHWVARQRGEALLFVTLDALGDRHDAQSLEAAYDAAAALADSGLEFVVACVPAAAGTFTVPLADGVLSATPWVAGARPDDAAPAVSLVARLHAAAVPRDIPQWRPLVPSSFADDLGVRLRATWSAGPLATQAQSALAGALAQVRRWTGAYHRLADVAHGVPWVPTHGEPHERNLMVTDAGPVLVDWESLKLGPAERDLRVVDPGSGNSSMLALFDLEWRLDEISQYATWFESPHSATSDDETALAGLLHELTRT